MSTQPPVSADEFVFRRIPAMHYDSSQPIPIQRVAFQPWPRDATGLSVYRERYVRPEEIVAALPEDKRPGMTGARLPVRELLAMGLTVVPEDDVLPGHAVIPELSRSEYERDKRRVKDSC